MAITINGSGTIGGVSVGGLPDGIVDTDMLASAAVTSAKVGSLGTSNLPAGSVLQIAYDALTSQFNTSSTSYVDTGLEITMTPRDANSKFLCMWVFNSNFGNIEGYGVNLVRNGSAVFGSATGYDTYIGGASGVDLHMRNSWMYLDSPATSSSVTYKVRVACNNTNTVQFSTAGNNYQFIVQEIAG